MSRINTGRVNTGRLGGRIRIRITRPWRGYSVGAIIDPPGGARQILLQARDQMGNRVAEIVDDTPAPEISNKAIVSDGRQTGTVKMSRNPKT